MLQTDPNWVTLSEDSLNQRLIEALDINGKVELSKVDYRIIFLDFFEKLRTFMSPEYDLGVKNIRLRGLLRIVIGIILPVFLSLVTMGGLWSYDTLDPSLQDPDVGTQNALLGAAKYIADGESRKKYYIYNWFAIDISYGYLV